MHANSSSPIIVNDEHAHSHPSFGQESYCKDDTPNACYTDISAEDLAAAEKYGDMMGEKALGFLSK
jgi:hypothetical protein